MADEEYTAFKQANAEWMQEVVAYIDAHPVEAFRAYKDGYREYTPLEQRYFKEALFPGLIKLREAGAFHGQDGKFEKEFLLALLQEDPGLLLSHVAKVSQKGSDHQDIPGTVYNEMLKAYAGGHWSEADSATLIHILFDKQPITLCNYAEAVLSMPDGHGLQDLPDSVYRDLLVTIHPKRAEKTCREESPRAA